MIDPVWLKTQADAIRDADWIDQGCYKKYNVKRGLRNEDGTGVLVGLTSIGSVHGYMVSESEKVRITWQWAEASGTLDGGYVTDGLVLRYDGIWNAGIGVHDSSAAVWKASTLVARS